MLLVHCTVLPGHARYKSRLGLTSWHVYTGQRDSSSTATAAVMVTLAHIYAPMSMYTHQLLFWSCAMNCADLDCADL